MVAFRPRGAIHQGRAVAAGPPPYRGGAAGVHGLRTIRPRHTCFGVRGGAAVAMSGLTHLDESGRARMVDVSDKDVTRREATARAIVSMQLATAQLIASGGVAKGGRPA